MTTFVFLGLLFVLYVCLRGFVPVVDTFSGGLVSFGGFVAGQGFDYRGLAVNMTRGCGDDSLCSATRIFDELKFLPYVSDGVGKLGLYSPDSVLVNGGDCKASSLLYSRLARSVGVDASVVCSFRYRHCVTRVVTERGVFAVDLTSPAVFATSEGDFWGYFFDSVVVYS